MSPEKLARAMSLLTKPIPPARRPAAKPQASWQELKVGQRLRNTDKLILGVSVVAAGCEWEVTQVDSLGAKLRHLDHNIFHTLRQPNWPSLFERVKAPRKRKAAPK